MKWATRENVHLDRVASAWLIRCFVDPAAEFFFIPPIGLSSLDSDVIPFALEGADLGPHDEEGSTFRKILIKHHLEDPALDFLAGIIEGAIALALSNVPDGSDVVRDESSGLNAIAIGMMSVTHGDDENIERSFPLYDALYAYCQASVPED